MYKDKAKQREATRLAVQKHRNKGITQGITQNVIPDPQNVIPTPVIPVIPAKNVILNVIPKELRPVTPLAMLANPEKMRKLEAICRELDRRKLGCHVWLGLGAGAITMDKVASILPAFTD